MARGITSGTIHERTILPGDACCTIAETHGGAFAMWQDEILELCNRGVKYLFSAEPHREDIFDIENFADFVQKRDKCLNDTFERYNLRLPEMNESLSEYIKNIEQVKDRYITNVNNQPKPIPIEEMEQLRQPSRLAQLAAEKEALVKEFNKIREAEKENPVKGKNSYEQGK